MGLEEIVERVEIGRGRSGRVFQSIDSSGNHVAIKVFTSEDFFSKLINYIFFGAPISYTWNADAVHSTHYSREILDDLVQYWTDGKVRVPKSIGVQWNQEFKAYELITEFIDGKHAALHHPFSSQTDMELSDLVNNIMKPLQDKLKEAGFDGKVWQAGLGNPAGPSSYMLEKNNENGNNWVWIDHESGVPAFNLLGIRSFISYYLPKAVKHRRILFDDVDIDKLRDYIYTNTPDLINKIGIGRYLSIFNNLSSLESHQKRWKSMRRAHRSVTYRLKKGNINQEQADWYFEHPDAWHDAIWYGREAVRLSGKAARKLAIDLSWEGLKKLVSLDYKKIASNIGRFVSSEKYRSELARNYVRGRIDEWEQRNQLDSEEASYLRSQLETTSFYLTDFLVHASLEIADWTMRGISVLLYSTGQVDLKVGVLGFFGAGSISRTGYTLLRMGYGGIKHIKTIPSNAGQFVSGTVHLTHDEGLKQGLKYSAKKILGIERLIALGIGVIPLGVGNLAYPVQMLYSGYTADRELGRFLLYDTASRIGQKIPIYGGRDTLTEHIFNHIPDLIVRNRNGLNSQYRNNIISQSR